MINISGVSSRPRHGLQNTVPVQEEITNCMVHILWMKKNHEATSENGCLHVATRPHKCAFLHSKDGNISINTEVLPPLGMNHAKKS